jgi:FkbH-like protein
MQKTKNNRAYELNEKCESRTEFAQYLRTLARRDLTLSELRVAVKLLREYKEPTLPLKIAVLGSYTTELLKDYWVFHGLIHGFDVDLYFAPYGQLVQELQDGSNLSAFRPDYTYLLMQWSDILPGLGKPLHGMDKKERDLLPNLFLSGLEGMLDNAQTTVRDGTVVVSLLPRFASLGLGCYDAMAERSESMFFAGLKESLSSLFRERFPTCHYDDGEHLLATLGKAGALDQRLWYSSRYPFSPKGGNLLVERLMRFPILERTPRAKCIVLDCDNTLWGGIIGEDGMAGIALGPEYPGNCFVTFQRRLLDMLNRGCLLAICSKNNPHDVRQVIREHPSMVLREENFAAILANWDPKPNNLSLLAEELSLGLDSFLFVDDSPHECRMVRNVLPEIRVVQVPEQPLEVPFCLDHLQELEILSLTDEDRQRFRMYVQNRRRKELAVTCGDLSDYLNSLKMKMRISVNDVEHVSRLSQMTQKTNQFNLTTKRYSEKDIRSFIDDDNWTVAHFSLSDIFGDNGIVGLMLASNITSDTVLIDTFLMSCRVIGRRAEEAFLYRMLRCFRELNKLKVKASYIPTSKNNLVEDFWAKQDFVPLGESYYESDLANLPEDHPSLSHFEIQLEEEA